MVLFEYNPQWPVQFEKIKSILKSKLSGIVFRIEHAGSTSIEDLSAKPKIDIYIVIPLKVPFESVNERLAELGYTHYGDLGIGGREAYLRKNKTFHDPILDSISHNLYACTDDSLELERLIWFRDYLRINEEARVAYEKLKQDIAERAGQDSKKYCILKETEARKFIYSIVEKARSLRIQVRSKVLSDYNTEWPGQFEKIKKILESKLSEIVFRIEHVGSTSINDLSAKPNIDIDIVIPKNVSLRIINEKLSELGYTHEGDLGCEGREAYERKIMKFYEPTLDSIRHNLYACPEDNLELERHILFRDYLRLNPEVRLAYEKLKQDIAERSGQNVKKYVMAKETEAEEFVYSIVEKAKQSKKIQNLKSKI